MDFEQSRPEEQPFSTPGHGEEKELTSDTPAPSATTDGAGGAKGEGDMSPHNNAPDNAPDGGQAASPAASRSTSHGMFSGMSSGMSFGTGMARDQSPNASHGRANKAGAPGGRPALDKETSAALAAKNASFGMSDGRESVSTGRGQTRVRMSGARFLHGRSWYFLLSVNILLAIVLSLTLVWVSIERMDANYFINLERAKLRDKQSLHAKLEVERERLLSPYELRINAERLGMKAPEPGQIRRMDLKRPGP